MNKKITEGRLITVPLSQLHISPLNARANDTSDVTELAALLDSQGQLQNLIVIPEDGDKGVVGGGRRYRAFKLLEEKGKLASDHPVFCLLTTTEHALKASVAENSAREPMHPADEFYAFKVLSEEGMPVEDIAAQFGVTPLVVRRRLALSDVAPELIEIYRRGEMTLDALQAFTLTADRKLQLKVWKSAQHPYQRNGSSLREALMAGKLQVSGERVAKFVGIDAYEAYLRERAWTWELQALVRARAVAGDVSLGNRFSRVRSALLGESRDIERVRTEISAMRTRWRNERDRSDAARFDLKQGVGGLVDIEFLLQGIVLQHAAKAPALLATGNTPELVVAAEQADIVAPDAARRLVEAHSALLAKSIECTLDGRPRIVARDGGIERQIEAVRDVARSLGLLDL